MEPYGSTALVAVSKRRKNKGYFMVNLTTPSTTQFTVPSGVVMDSNKLLVMQMEGVVF
jgi:hypothetical protein